MILVDTSAWIDFFRGSGRHAQRVDALLASHDVAVCGPVLTEIGRGLSSAKQQTIVLSLLDGCHSLDQPQQLWRDAGDLGFYLARRGVSCKSFDLLIATYALSHAVGLLSSDKDFVRMQRAGVPLLLA